jgi:Protein of unknown function (DUF3108)
MMPASLEILTRKVFSWKRLLPAIAISLIAHFAALTLANQSFLSPFRSAASLGGMSMRTIESAPPTAALPPALPPQPPARQLQSPNDAAPMPANIASVPAVAPSAPVEPAPLPATQIPSLNEPIVASLAASTETKQIVIALSSTSDESTATSAEAGTASPALQLQLPSNSRLQFTARSQQSGQTREGKGQLIWQSDGQTYSLKIEATMLLFTVLEWSSEGKITEVGLSPVRFSEKRGFRSEQATHFRQEIGKIQFSNNKPEAILEGGAQDRLSVMLLLSSLLAGNPGQIQPSSIIRIQVASTDLAETWDIRYEGQEEIMLPTGAMLAHKLTRNPRREFDRKLDLWLAPSLGYLPVRILLSSTSPSNEDTFDLKLSALP